MEILSLPPGDTLTTTLSVDSHQYYLTDPDTTSDYGGATQQLDGVIGPQSRLVQVATGVPTGLLTVTLHAFSPGEERSDDLVSAESDLELAAGHFLLTAMGEKKITIDWAGARRLRLRVVVHGRDAALTYAGQEAHELWIWPTDAPRPRWRSTSIDQLGTSLTLTTAHLRTGT